MGHFPLTNCKILLGQYDLTGDTNKIKIDRSQKEWDDTTYGSGGWRGRGSGLLDGVFGMAGIIDTTAAGQDEALSNGQSLSNVPMLVTLRGATVFDRTKFGVIQQGQYQVGGGVGQRAEWNADGRISGYVLVNGFMMAVGAKTGTFNGSYLDIGGVLATQKLYAQIHATVKSSFTSAVFKVQSADDAIGTNLTDRITFTTITGLTSQFATPVAGAITQTFWRVICSAFTGTSLTVYGAVGIN